MAISVNTLLIAALLVITLAGSAWLMVLWTLDGKLQSLVFYTKA
jgi:hypothetical protein